MRAGKATACAAGCRAAVDGRGGVFVNDGAHFRILELAVR